MRTIGVVINKPETADSISPVSQCPCRQFEEAGPILDPSRLKPPSPWWIAKCQDKKLCSVLLAAN